MLLAIDTATNLAGIALLGERQAGARPLAPGVDRRGSRARDEAPWQSQGTGLTAAEQTVLGAYQWQTGRNHTVELMPNIIRLLAQAGVRAAEVQAVAVAIGPGSYTGLRIGLSVAKGFCFAQRAGSDAGAEPRVERDGNAAGPQIGGAGIGTEVGGGVERGRNTASPHTLGVVTGADAGAQAGVERGGNAPGSQSAGVGPGTEAGIVRRENDQGSAGPDAVAARVSHGPALVAVPTLDISAMMCPPREGVLCAILQAGRGRLVGGYYRSDSGQWQSFGELFFGRAAELAEACAGRATYFAGELDADTLAVLRARLEGLAEFVPEDMRARDPRVLARLGWQRLLRGQVDNLETLSPAYGQ